MNLRYYVIGCAALLGASHSVFGEDLPPWRSQGWCDYRWNPDGDPPPRLNLPEWVCRAAYDEKLHVKYSIYSKINPFFMNADLNGDGQLDAAVWIVESRTNKRGLVIFHRGAKRPYIFAAGTVLAGRGDDLGFIDQWSLIPRGEKLESPYEAGRTVLLKSDALVLDKSESSSFSLYWSDGRYKSYQISD